MRIVEHCSPRYSSLQQSNDAHANYLQVCQSLREHKADMAPFVDSDFDEYVDRMARPATWGGEPELAVAADVLGLPIRVQQRTQVRGSVSTCTRMTGEYCRRLLTRPRM